MLIALAGASALCVAGAAARLNADTDTTFDPSLYSDMRWRAIGPFRGGRTVGAAGVVLRYQR